jgi:hypothetical protein
MSRSLDSRAFEHLFSKFSKSREEELQIPRAKRPKLGGARARFEWTSFELIRDSSIV